MRKYIQWIAAFFTAVLVAFGIAMNGGSERTVSAAPLPPEADSSYELSTIWERTGYENGRFYCYRLPGIVTLEDGSLLAYCEKRMGSDGLTASSDQALMNIIAKKSTDGGKTWGEDILVVDGENMLWTPPGTDTQYPTSVSGPVMAVDGNKIYCFYLKQWYWHVVEDGKTVTKWSEDGPIMNIAYKYSTDGGETWSAENDITDQIDQCLRELGIIDPDLPADAKDGRGYLVTGAGHGIVLQHQKPDSPMPNGTVMFMGWMVTKADIEAVGGNITAQYPARNLLVYSSDDGATWKVRMVPRDAADDVPDMNESSIAENADGSLYVNGRSWNRSDVNLHYRAVSFSPDGGYTWESARLDRTLLDPGTGCFGSLLSYDDDMMLFIHCDDEDYRTNVTIEASFDGGRTWTLKKRLPYAEMDNVSDGGYCDLTRDAEGNIFAIVEETTSNYARVYVFKLTPEWFFSEATKLHSLTVDGETMNTDTADEYVVRVPSGKEKAEISFTLPAQKGYSVSINGVETAEQDFETELIWNRTVVDIAVGSQWSDEQKHYTVLFLKESGEMQPGIVQRYLFDDAATSVYDSVSMNFAETSNIQAAEGRTAEDGAALFESGAYALVRDALNSDFGKGAFAVNLWLKPESVTGTQYYLCVGREGMSEGYFSVKSVDGKVVFEISDGREISRAETDTALAAGRWASVTAVVTDNEQKIFLNGELAASVGKRKFNVSGENSLFIGASSNLNSFCDAVISEIAVFSGELTDGAVKSFCEGKEIFPVAVSADEYTRVTISAPWAAEGDAVRIEAKCSGSLRIIKEVQVIAENGDAVAVEQDDTGWNFRMPASAAEVVVTSENESYEVTVAETEGGRITASRTGVVYKDTKIEFFFEPEEGYRFVSAAVNGQTVETVAGRYVLPALSGDVHVTAVFEKQAEPDTKGTGCGSALTGMLSALTMAGAACAAMAGTKKTANRRKGN
mgnify:CR=1 FL=1